MGCNPDGPPDKESFRTPFSYFIIKRSEEQSFKMG